MSSPLPQRKPYDIDHMFSHRDPGEQLPGFAEIRAAARVLAEVVVENTPAGPDQDDALRHVRKAMLMAREAIELQGDLLQCDTIAKKLSTRVFDAAAMQRSRVREIRMNTRDAWKLLGHAYFERVAGEIKPEGLLGHMWGAAVTASNEVVEGQVIAIFASDGDGDEGGGGLASDAVSLA